MYAGLAPYEALALYAVITYMDSVEGVFVPEGGMHMMAAGLADASPTPASRSATTPRSPHPAPCRRGGHRRRDRRLRTPRRRRRRLQPRPPRRLPRAAPRRRRSSRAARKGKYSPSCLLWVAGVKGLPPADGVAPQHPLRRGLGRLVQGLIDDGVRMPDPSILVTLHSLDDRSLAPGGHSSIYVLEPTPNLSGTIDWSREREPITTASASGSSRSATRPRSSSRRSTTRPTGSAWAWNRARRSRWPTRSSRPARSGPTTSTSKVPGLVFTGSSTLPGVGVPMVLVSGKLAAQRVEYAAAIR
jgi:phytoene desaturase